MVYFKITKELLDLIYESKLEGLVGCQKYCDRQYISYTDIDKVVSKLKKEIADVREKLKKKEDLERKKKEFAANSSDLFKSFELLEMTTGAKVTESNEELEE
jgi:transcription initiation factor IIE alpha subunit